MTCSDEPSQRVVMGISSGAIGAFSTAFFAPEAFGNVISHCGSCEWAALCKPQTLQHAQLGFPHRV